jgi:PBSX family phage terminase large subunit
MNEIKVNNKFKPLFQQLDGVRYYVVVGGRGSGKSFGIGLWATLKTYEPDNRILYTRWTMISANISIIPEFTDKVELLGKQSDFYTTSNEVVNTTTKTDIIFKGIKTSSGNQTASLKSIQGITTWILDEAEELVDETIFNKIDLSIRSVKQKNIVILVLNPSNKEHWIYKRFYERNNVQDGFNGVIGDTCFIHTTYKDNLHNLSDSFLNTVEWTKLNEPNNYLHLFEGQWNDESEGKLLPLKSLKFAPMPKDNEDVVANLAFSDPADGGGDKLSTIFVRIKYKDGVFRAYIVDVVHSSLGIQSNATRIMDRLKKHNIERIFIEKNGVGAALVYELENLNDTDCKIQPYFEKMPKVGKINSFYEFVQTFFIFDENYLEIEDYKAFIKDLTTYERQGQNHHIKDAIDVCSSAAKGIKVNYSSLLFNSQT